MNVKELERKLFEIMIAPDVIYPNRHAKLESQVYALEKLVKQCLNIIKGEQK